MMKAKRNLTIPHIRSRWTVVVLAAVLIVSGTSALLFAKYINNSGELENRFNPSEYDRPVVSDSMSKDVDGYYYKHNLKVTPAEETNYPVYVRVAIVPTWTDNDGNIFGQQPVKDKDYSLTFDTDNWFLYTDGFYYCKTPVTGGNSTPELITRYRALKQLRDAPFSEYDLHVEVVAETVQAIGTKYEGLNNKKDAVLDAWGLNPSAHE